jgi:hypothetical protein
MITSKEVLEEELSELQKKFNPHAENYTEWSKQRSIRDRMRQIKRQLLKLNNMSKLKFPKELRSQWLEALRSGDYEQGSKVLRNKSYTGKYEYCCLGVLCEITGIPYDSDASAPLSGLGDGISTKELETRLKQVGMPDFMMVEWKYNLNLRVKEPRQDLDSFATKKDFVTALATMNDDMGMSFSDIAHYIERVTEPV